MNETDNKELEVEDEQDDVPSVEYDISVNPSDHSLELLSQMISREDIIIPFYQRKFVWKIEQASKLIESFLMGLPVPQVFLYVNDEDQLEVIDGQQRLMSVHYFLTGYFGDVDSRNNRKIFKLKGLAQRSEYNGKSFEELSSRDQRKLRNSTLRAIHIKQIKPSGEGDAVFHIFERLNTGGTQLKPQEIRNAVYRGPIVDDLQSLNLDQNWRLILGMPTPDKSQKDVELILRLFSMFESWEKFQRPMLQFLNRTMKRNKDINTPKATRFKLAFSEAADKVAKNIEKPFPPRRVVNSAVLEAVMIAIMEENISEDELSRNYEALISNEHFSEVTTVSTSNESSVNSRIILAKDILKNGKSRGA